MSQIKIKTLLEVAPRLPAWRSVLLRGDHGIGKSQLVRQIAQLITEQTGVKLPVRDVRIAQMSDGDMIGLPYFDEKDGTKATRFAPPEWYMSVVDQPGILFLDELNRGSTEIQQACFQIVLDREMNGVKLHPQTRVFAAINMASIYNVNQMDPALLDRLWVMDLDPETDEWLAWARRVGISADIVEFINNQPMWLDPPKKSEVGGGKGAIAYDPTEVHPSRRSWEMVDRMLKEMNLTNNHTDPAWHPTVAGNIGAPATIAFFDFLKLAAEENVTGDEVIDGMVHDLTGGSKSKKKKTAAAPGDLTNVAKKLHRLAEKQKLNPVIDSFHDAVRKRDLGGAQPVSKEMGENIAAFFAALPPELRYVAWVTVTKGKMVKFITAIHPYVINMVLEIFKGDKPGETKTPKFVEEAHKAAAEQPKQEK